MPICNISNNMPLKLAALFSLTVFGVFDCILSYYCANYAYTALKRDSKYRLHGTVSPSRDSIVRLLTSIAFTGQYCEIVNKYHLHGTVLEDC